MSAISGVRVFGGPSTLIITYEDGEHLLFRLPSAGIYPALGVLLGERPSCARRRGKLLEQVVLRTPSDEELRFSKVLPDGLDNLGFWSLVRRAFE